MNTTIEIYHEWEEVDGNCIDGTLKINFDFSAYYTPARINCRVEDSSPEEGDSSWEIQKVLFEEKEVEFDELPQYVQEHINETVNDWVEENGLQEIEDDDYERRGEAQYDAQQDRDDFHYERGY